MDKNIDRQKKCVYEFTLLSLCSNIVDDIEKNNNPFYIYTVLILYILNDTIYTKRYYILMYTLYYYKIIKIRL